MASAFTVTEGGGLPVSRPTETCLQREKLLWYTEQSFAFLTSVAEK